MAKIESVIAREILDSRGTPTIETVVTLKTGLSGVASVPSGASIGKHEALEIRDGDPARFGGLGVLKAVRNVNKIIAPLLKGMEVGDQLAIDKKMLELDGTHNKSRLGANAILSVSQGVCEAAAAGDGVSNFEHVARLYGIKRKRLEMPIPTFNLINGGKHGTGNLDFQEYHLVPAAMSYHKALRMSDEIYQQVKKILAAHDAAYSVGDEGGFTPELFTNVEALKIIIQAIEISNYKFEKDMFLGLDVAATSFYRKGRYKIKDQMAPMPPEKFIDFYQKLNKEYPLLMLEDPLHEDDFDNWGELAKCLPETILVGDDLLVTNPDRVKKAIKKKACSAVLVKPNQIGTITETIQVIKLAREANWKVIVSHRSGETNDDFIADFAVGVGADYTKFGAPARGERVVKYNRLLEIEREIESNK